MTSSAYRVEITQKADEDFRLAIAHYASVTGIKSAKKFVSRYEEVLGYLETVPSAAARIGSSNCQWLPVRSHILVYSIDEETSTVYVSRIHYRSLNWRDIIEGTNPA